MAKDVYYRGVPGKKYGIWDGVENCWKHDICEDTPMLAMARLFQRIGAGAKSSRYEPRMLPDKVAHSA
jgi:hypothetical protein